jgi:Asp-tRNA(Asn)/Glu-tRNA(Gln) amidotransferase A subunit family amidase
MHNLAPGTVAPDLSPLSMPEPTSHLADLPIRDVLEGLTRRVFTTRTYLEALFDRHDEAEPVVRAFVWLDRTRARAEADGADRRRARNRAIGALDGVPVGVKDVFDTAAIPTECGSVAFAGRVPSIDAAAVTALAAAGAWVLGKTVTAELAYLFPGPTTNPWDVSRTPGGSSMGSAAAVAAGLVPLAIGTQTNGSVIRPAAFCGVVGFKPTLGRLSMGGCLPFSPSNDQGGLFARDVDGVARGAAAWAGEPQAEWVPASNAVIGAAPRIGAVRTDDWNGLDRAAREATEGAVETLRRAGATIFWVDCPPEINALLPVHRTIMSREGADNLDHVRASHDRMLSPTLRAYLDEGAGVSNEALEAARVARQRAIKTFVTWMNAYDVIMTPAAPGEAPTPETTGDPRCQTRWQSVGAPVLCLPCARGPHGLPLAVQIVGPRGADARLLRAAAWIEARLTHPGRPGLRTGRA